MDLSLLIENLKPRVPKALRPAIRLALGSRTVDAWSKTLLFHQMHRKHQNLLKQLKGKKKIRIVFLAIHKSVWKVDPVFKRMLEDAFFDPVILVCPYTTFGEKQMWEDLRESLDYFQGKGYPTISSYDAKEDRWLTLKELETDIVFFTNPHNLTRKEYYEDAYLNYLSCYAGYGMQVTHYDEGQSQYNQLFHNAVWKIFTQNRHQYNCYSRFSRKQNYGLHLAIDAIAEEILSWKPSVNSVWKNPNTHKKIIWAPHHSIEPNGALHLGNFLDYAEPMLALVKDTEDQVTWSFKPHPLLKPKLLQHPEWGPEKVSAYFGKWEGMPNSQLDEGEYIDLFCESDALIHDSASFLAEYIFTSKPMAFLVNADTTKNLSVFGKQCLRTAVQVSDICGVCDFVEDLLRGGRPKLLERSDFIERYLDELGTNTTSAGISNILKEELIK